MRAFHALVSGRVQGVFFRSTARDRAASLDLEGWVRNLPDGRVEVFAQGDSERLEVLRRWLERGPSGAHVEDVQVDEAEPDPSLDGFGIGG